MIIKPYQKGDEKKILELFEICFGKKLSEEYWKWRFIQNPFSNSTYIDLMWEADQLIGHYAISPIDMLYKGEVMKTALSMTTMTHPDFGGKGVFSKLASNLYSRLSSDSFDMIWGFPNVNSHYGFNKNLNWKDICIQPMLSLETQKIKTNLKEFSLDLHESSFDSVDFSIFSRNKKSIQIYKTTEYFLWRYHQNPSEKYKIIYSISQKIGVIYKKIESFTQEGKYEIDIMEINFNNDINDLSTLLNKILEIEQNINKFNLWDSLFSEEQLVLEKIGFRFGLPLTYLGACILKEKKELLEYKNWDINFGYSDVF